MAVALVHSCCSPGEQLKQDVGAFGNVEMVDGEADATREAAWRRRLRHLVEDRAFCCLLMKVAGKSYGVIHGGVTAAY